MQVTHPVIPNPTEPDLTRAQRVSIAHSVEINSQRTTNMNTQTKTWIRTAVVAGIIAWPAVETFRLIATQQKLAEAETLQRSVQTKVETARTKHVQVAGSGDATAAPDTK